MDDNRMHRLLARKMAGELSEQESRELEELYAKHPESLYNMELLMQLWQQEGLDDVEDSFARHRARYKDEFEVQHPAGGAINPFPVHPKRRLLAPILVTALLAVALFFFVGLPAFVKNKDVVAAPRQVFAAKGRKQKIVLPDNTQVWLNADSKLSYDSNMNNEKTRVVYLTGEAFFDVTKRQEPFIIHTSKISIKVLGTAFNVKAYPGEKITETTLLRGVVELSVNNRPEKKIILKPNEKFALIDSTSVTGHTAQQADNKYVDNSQQMIVGSVVPVVVADKEYLEETSWVENMLVFRNETLEDLAPKLERWYDIEIELENDVVKSYHYTGVFEKESIKDALDAMSLIRPFHYKINTNNNSITIY